jgi:hypothetical protein
MPTGPFRPLALFFGVVESSSWYTVFPLSADLVPQDTRGKIDRATPALGFAADHYIRPRESASFYELPQAWMLLVALLLPGGPLFDERSASRDANELLDE